MPVASNKSLVRQSKGTLWTQAMYHSSRRKRQASFTPLRLLSPTKPPVGFCRRPRIDMPFDRPLPPEGGEEAEINYPAETVETVQVPFSFFVIV